MSKKAIYDDQIFFNNYVKLREQENNYNDLIEQPIIMDLLGDVKGKTVLDLGCGFGSLTTYLADSGAKEVVGIDISEKMIEKAKNDNSRENVEYYVMAAEHLKELNKKFDIVVSCLALHYIENLDNLFASINNVLNQKGTFVFSMEHPIYTATMFGQRWITHREKAQAFILDHYGQEGKREIDWLEQNITKYHHKIDTILNSLIKNNFLIEKVIEPSPTEELLEAVSKTYQELHRPAYLIIKCQKDNEV